MFTPIGVTNATYERNMENKYAMVTLGGLSLVTISIVIETDKDVMRFYKKYGCMVTLHCTA